MELILINDVPNLGFKDDIVSVKNGYGRNFLIPQATILASSAKKILNENIKQREFKEKKVIEDATKLEKKLSKLDIKIPAKVGKAGKLFGSISNADLNNELTKLGYDFDKNIVSIRGGLIKKVGNYTANKIARKIIVEILLK